MTIGEHLSSFNGKTVSEFDPEKGIRDPIATCYRVGLTYEDFDSGGDIVALWEKFANDKNAKNVTEVVVGVWSYEYEEDNSELVAAIVKNANKLRNLEAIMFGDITFEEQEISWIGNSNVTPVIHAFPKLREFRVRGGNNLSFAKLAHPKLEKLVVEAGGLSAVTINEAVSAKCPEMKHFELWLGVEDYGFDGSVHNLRPVLTGSVFPKLQTLALRNAAITDEIAQALSIAEAADASSVEIEGNTFVLTGTLHKMTRSEAKKQLEALGAKVASSVSKNTNYLIAGEKAGSKMEQAKSLGVPVLSEADMLELLGETSDAVSSGTTSILDRIEVLDLSMGTLTDKGAEALFNNPKIKQLKKVDIDHHFLSDEWMEKLATLPNVYVGDRSDMFDEYDPEDEYSYRYPDVTE